MARPISIYLDEGELAGLEDWARERGWPRSRAIRFAIRELVRPAADDPILGVSGMFEPRAGGVELLANSPALMPASGKRAARSRRN